MSKVRFALLVLHRPEEKPFDGASVHLFNLVEKLGARAPLKTYRSILSLLRDRKSLQGCVIYTRDIVKLWRLVPFKAFLPPLILEVNGLPSYELEINRRTQGSRLPLLTPLLKRLWGIKEWMAFRLADRILPVTKGLGDTIARDYGCKRSKITVIPNAVDIERFRPKTSRRKGPRKILFAGAFLPHRDSRRIVEIAREVLDECPKASFNLVGYGPELGAIRDLVRKYGMGHAFTFTPNLHHKEMAGVIDRADICLYDYLRNDWEYYRKIGICPLKILEYMAAGKAIVAVRFPGLPEELEKARAAAIARGPEEVPSKIITLLRRPGVLATYGKRARRLAERAYGWDKVANRITAIAADLIEGYS